MLKVKPRNSKPSSTSSSVTITVEQMAYYLSLMAEPVYIVANSEFIASSAGQPGEVAYCKTIPEGHGPFFLKVADLITTKNGSVRR